MRLPRILLHFSFLASLAGFPARTHAGQDLSNQLYVQTSNERTSLDRVTGILTSTVDVRFINLGGRALSGPMHAVIETTPTNGVEVVGALGGLSAAPYQRPYVDLTPQLGAQALPNGASVATRLTFRRDRDVQLTYRIVPYGELDTQSAPQLAAAGPYRVREGEELTFPISASDPDGDLAALAVTRAPSNSIFQSTGPGAGTLRFTPSFEQEGYHSVTFRASDARGLADHATVEIEVENVNRPPALSAVPTNTLYEGELLTVQLSSTDPDGDTAEIVPGTLPSNAYYFAESRLLTFAPDFSQAGDYLVPFVIEDASSTGNTELVSITVLDLPQADTATNALTLVINPVPNPTFADNQRVTGFVNGSGPNPYQPVKTALISGLVPSVARRGQRVDVTLSGANSGPFATAFRLESQVDFGPGITVSNPRVVNPSQITVTVDIAANAELGARSVQVVTGGEAAFSVVGFQVQAGDTRLSGRVVAPGTGAPVNGAIVTIEGTPFRAVTGPDGTFSFANLPSGSAVLLINAPNQEAVRIPVDVQEGQAGTLGDFSGEPTVYDPSAPAEASVMSVVGRGATYGLGGRFPLNELRAMITDSLLVVGGSQAGVMDSSGVQLNPLVTGPGLVSLTPAGVERLAFMMDRGNESITLGELLYAISHGFLWSPGGAPNLAQWLTLLQGLVNAAWSDPGLPDHYLPVLIFNRGLVLASDPPQLTSETRLNPLQAYLFLSSLFATVADHEAGNARATPALHAFPSFSDLIFPSAHAQAPGNADRRFTGFWRGFFQQKGNFVLSQYNLAYSRYIAVLGSPFTLGPSLLGVLGATAATAPILGVVTQNLNSQIKFMGLEAQVPEPPVITSASVYRNIFGLPYVRFSFVPDKSHFRRTNSDQGRNTTGMVYALYRYRDPDAPRELVGSLVLGEQSIVRNPLDGADVSLNDVNEGDLPKLVFTLEDDSPLRYIQDNQGHVILEPSATHFYTLVAMRVVNPRTQITKQFLENAKPFWQLPLGSLPSLTPFVNRNIDAAAGVQYPIISDYSKPVVITATSIEQKDAVAIEVSPTTGEVFSLSPPPSQRINREILEVGGGQAPFTDAGFKAAGVGGFPRGGPFGLAVDAKGDVYTGNAASEDQFGGRIFRFDGSSGAREHVGALNYYSLDLAFSHPSEIGPMDIGPGWNPGYSPQDLYVADQLAGVIKKVPVQANGVEGRRRVGQPWAGVPYQARVVDLETQANGDAHAVIERFPGLVLIGKLSVVPRRLAPEELSEVTFTVTNPSPNGTVRAVRMLPLLQEGDGTLVEHTSISPVSVDLGPGQSTNYTLQVRGVLPGRVLLRAVASGRDADDVTISTVTEPLEGLPVFVESPLEINEMTALPRRVAPGGMIDVSFEVFNGGRGDITGISLDLKDEPLVISEVSTGSVSLVTAAAPTGFTLAANARQVVTARYQAVDLGQLRFTVRASGLYTETNQILSSNRAITKPVTITPLDFGVYSVPTFVKLEPASTVDVIVSVTNITNQSLTLITPSLARSGGDAIFREQIPALPRPLLSAGATHDFHFTLRNPSQAGEVLYDASLTVVLPNLKVFGTDSEETRILIGPTIRGRIYDYQPIFKPIMVPGIRQKVPLAGVHINLLETNANNPAPETYSAITDANGEFRIPLKTGGSFLLSGMYPGLNIGFKQPVYVKSNLTEGPLYEFTLPRTVIQQILDNREKLTQINVEVPGSNVFFPFDNKNYAIENKYDMAQVDMLLNFVRKGINSPRFGGALVSAGGSQLWDAVVRLDFFLEDLRIRMDETKRMADSASSALVEILMATYINKALDKDVNGIPNKPEDIQKKLVKGSPDEDLPGAVGLAEENRSYLQRQKSVNNATNAIRNFMKNKNVNRVMDKLPQGLLDYAFGRPVTKKDKEAIFARVSKTIHTVLDLADTLVGKFNLKDTFGSQIAMGLQIAITELLIKGYIDTTQVFLNDFIYAAQEPNNVKATNVSAMQVLYAHNQVLAAKNEAYYRDLNLIAETNQVFKDSNKLNDDWKKYYKDKVYDGVKGGFKKAQDAAGKIAKPLKLIHIIGVATQIGFLQPAEVCRMSKALLSGSMPTLDNDAEGAACILIRF